MKNRLNESLKIFLSLDLAVRERLNIHIEDLFPVHFLIVHVAQYFHDSAPSLDMTFNKSREDLAGVLGLRHG